MDECDYCKNHIRHDGKCPGKYNNIIPCLNYEKDPRGKLVYEDCILNLPFYLDAPELNKDCKYYQIGGINKTIQIIRINKISWHKDKTGLHGIKIYAEIRYWSEENGVIKKTPKLTLVKGGKPL